MFAASPFNGVSVYIRQSSVPEIDHCLKALSVNCDEILSGTKDSDYRGCQFLTKSGKICQEWAFQSPHAHSITPVNYPNKGLDFAKNNMCRNPDQSMETIWCFTTDPLVVKEECVPVNHC